MTKYSISIKPPNFNIIDKYVVVFAYQEKTNKCVLTTDADKLDHHLNQAISKFIQLENYKADSEQLLKLNLTDNGSNQVVILVGLGDISNLKIEKWMSCVAVATRSIKQINPKIVNYYIPHEITSVFEDLALSRAVESVNLSQYEFKHHKSENIVSEIETVFFYTDREVKNATSIIENAEIYSESVINTRNLINEPASVTTPKYLAEFALNIAKTNPTIKCEVLDPKQIRELEMNAFLGIAQGSDEEPRFIKLEYNPKGLQTICLVGKGITFDSGGLSLKPEAGMETMKCDMAGAAAVLGIFCALSKLKSKYHIVGLIAATENMPSGKAIKPGDIVRALNGKTIEIANTDAEGRVILADAVSYAVKFIHPSEIIDLATLTGACMVALGEDIAGLFTNNHDQAQDLIKSAIKTGERVWELPLVKEYQELLKSNVADIRNVSKTRYGGAITGALFISNFIPDNIFWVHLDIAGPAFIEKDSPMTPVGGSGFAVRMLLDYLTNR
jgi:leucyl aminopeptidase